MNFQQLMRYETVYFSSHINDFQCYREKYKFDTLKKESKQPMIDNKQIAGLRKIYSKKSLSEDSVLPDPHEQFNLWINEALNSGIDEPNAMTLATSSKDGIPGLRTVLLKGISSDGYVFYTNYQSKKAKDLEENPKAAIMFLWKELERQLIVTGSVEKVSRAESLDYFNSRPRESKIGSWSSVQSSEIPDRKSIEDQFESYSKKFDGKEIPLPDFWGGFKLIPERYEFWQGRENRLHDRICYLKEAEKWKIVRLSP